MVEMRWLKRPSALQQPNSNLVYMEKVLQYRKAIRIQQKDAQGMYVLHDEWSEWMDVPTVEEGK